MATMNGDKYTKAINPKMKAFDPKMKGLFKGLRYISQIFEEEKEEEEEMQIGLPTDVKHVAHIGSDGPSHEGPSWMRDFKAGSQSPNKEDEDSKRGNKVADSPGRDSQEVPRPSRHRRTSSESSAGDSSPKKKDPTSKSRSSRRSKESSEQGGHKSTSRQLRELSGSTQGNPPDVPKKTRRKKSKESVTGTGSGRSRSRASNGGTSASTDDDSMKRSREGDPGKNDEE